MQDHGSSISPRLFVLALAACLTSTASPTPASSPSQLAAVDVLAQGFDDPFGVAVDDQGSIVVSDRKAGTITQIARDGTRSVLVDGLEGPAGIAFDVDGGLLIAEERGRRILKRSLSGSLAVVTSGIVSPRWIIVGAGGAVYVSAKQEVPVVRGRAGLDEEDDDGQGSGRRILEVLPAGGVRTVADRFQGLEGLAWLDGSLYAALRHTTRDRGSDHTWIVRVPIGADGAGGTPAAVMRGRGNRPTGVAVDRLGALFVANRSDDDRDEREGAVLKRITPGQAAPVLTGIRKPQGIAFEPEGHLLVVEGGHHGRLLRLRAPSPPAVTAPAFTNQAPLAVTGETVPGALVRVFPDGDFVHPLASAAADAGTGAFVVFVPLALNADTDVSFVATAVGGLGLTSAPARRTIMHDNLAPIATIHDVPPEVHVRDSLLLRGRGEDDGSGVARLDVALDAAIVASFDNPHPDEPIEREAAIDARAPLAEGPHTVAVTATDRAGNMGSAHRLIVVDRTPPVTAIASGPTGEIADTTVTFIVTGTDVYSPMLDFSWRLDAGAWSPFAPATTIVLSSLTPGTHVFAVRARDLAGNENGLTPAVRVFTVRSLRVRILEPADGAVITTNSAWIRGTVEAGSGEVAVSLMLSPGLGGRLTVPAEGGMFAMDVALDAALTRVTVVAADASGATAEASVSVVVASDGTSAEVLDVWPPGGLAPLTVRVGLQGRGDGPLSIDVDGDGTPEFEGAFDGDEFYATYPVAGAYVPTVRITTPDGSVLTRRGLVEVYDRAVLESRLQAVWKGFKDALRDGNVEAAAAFIAAERRAAWIDYLSSLPAEAFADVDLVFTAIALVEAGYGGAQYEMVAERDGLLFSYAVWFRIDAEGRWRLWRF